MQLIFIISKSIKFGSRQAGIPFANLNMKKRIPVSKIPIPKEHRRGNDRRTDAERKAAGRKQRKARTQRKCRLCHEKLARRGWGKGLCTKCAKGKGYKEPQPTKSHHKMKAIRAVPEVTAKVKKFSKPQVKKELDQGEERNCQKKFNKFCNPLVSDTENDEENDKDRRYKYNTVWG